MKAAGIDTTVFKLHIVLGVQPPLKLKLLMSQFKVIPQKLKLPMNFFKLSLNVLYQTLFRKIQ